MKISYINPWKSSQFEVCYLLPQIIYCTTMKMSWKIVEEGPFLKVFTTFLAGVSVKCACYWADSTWVLMLYNKFHGKARLGVCCNLGHLWKSLFFAGSNFQYFEKLSTYMIGFNTSVKKLFELDALDFQITNWLIHKYCRRLFYRENNSCCLPKLKATRYLDY